MKPNHFGQKLVLSVLTLAVLAACSSTPMKPAVIEDRSKDGNASNGTGNNGGANDGADANGVKEVVVDSGAAGSDANNPLRDPNNILSKRSIYFGYDSDAIAAEFKDLVAAHGKYLGAHPDAKVILQGNTDERGTREYNLSLGQRRSVAVKKALNLAGVKETQIETVSYGEEKAAPNCGTDSCDKDRRVDIVYEGE